MYFIYLAAGVWVEANYSPNNLKAKQQLNRGVVNRRNTDEEQSSELINGISLLSEGKLNGLDLGLFTFLF